jgi:hypothetical protein
VPLAQLTLKDIKEMPAKDIRAAYTNAGLIAPKARSTSTLRNYLLAARRSAEARLQAAVQALGVGQITTQERARLKLLEEKLAILEKKRADEDADVNIRPAKRPRLLTEPKGRELIMGEAGDDGTFTLIENTKDPLRVLFFDKGGYGYKVGGDPPSDKATARYLSNYVRVLAKELTVVTVSKIAQFDWRSIDIADFAKEELESVREDRKSFDSAVDTG